MAPIEIQLVDLNNAAKLIPENTPVVMINLIKFKPQTTYPEGTPYTAMSGEEAYATHYVSAFFEFFKSKAEGSEPPFKVLFSGKPQTNLVAQPYGGKETWDRVAILWYPDFATFRLWVESKEYKEGPLIHRLASLEDYRLYAAIE